MHNDVEKMEDSIKSASVPSVITVAHPLLPLLPWLIIGVLTATLTVITARQALERYQELNSGWSWDLAYYNQWFWALTKGDGVVTVRPASSYGDEGPSVWKMNYLAPIRFAIVPIYMLFPDPRTLLVVHSVVFWLVIPAAFTLVRSETGSTGVALSAAMLVPGTPLLWPLVWNDFRELQLAFPFVLWAIQGYRNRDRRLTALAILGLVACRQEYALMVASFALLPPRRPEDIGRTYLWSQTVLMLGVGWMLFGFFGYLRIFVGATIPELYIQQFGGEKAGIGQTLTTSWDFLVFGLGPWALLACLSPRAALLVLPWLWSLSSGRWALRYLSTEHWHHVRYTAPFVAMGLAAGLLGYSRLASWLSRRRGGPAWLAIVWIGAAVGFLVADLELFARFEGAPRTITKSEAAEVWKWIDRVGPDECVLAAYEVTAPLSSRRHLYSYVLTANRPKGYPVLGPEFRWVFLHRGDLAPKSLLDQGFELVYPGSFVSIFHRGEGIAASK
jgi:uncharacterized membrane protein